MAASHDITDSAGALLHQRGFSLVLDRRLARRTASHQLSQSALSVLGASSGRLELVQALKTLLPWRLMVEGFAQPLESERSLPLPPPSVKMAIQ